jgi:hypothetical protein
MSCGGEAPWSHEREKEVAARVLELPAPRGKLSNMITLA